MQSVSGGEVVCTTASHGRTSAERPGTGEVALVLAGVGAAAATGNATYEYVDLWSRRTTWAAATRRSGVETDGESVWIQPGQRILLDADVQVYMLIVQGTLEFDRKDLRLDANTSA